MSARARWRLLDVILCVGLLAAAVVNLFAGEWLLAATFLAWSASTFAWLRRCESIYAYGYHRGICDVFLALQHGSTGWLRMHPHPSDPLPPTE